MKALGSRAQLYSPSLEHLTDNEGSTQALVTTEETSLTDMQQLCMAAFPTVRLLKSSRRDVSAGNP